MTLDTLIRLFHRLFPPQPFIRPRDKLFSALGAFLGILGLSWITQQIIPTLTLMMVASMGASAVLLFAAPHSPLAQPWPFVGGNLLSAAIGVACAHTISDPSLAGATAVSLSILSMSLLHCLHPPGGATALTAVIGGEAVHELGFDYVLMPVGINVLALLLLTLIFKRWLSPERHSPLTSKSTPELSDPNAIATVDLEYAMKEIGAFIDINTDDLERLHALALKHAQQRTQIPAKNSSRYSEAKSGRPVKALFTLAFRPFFLLASGYSVLTMLAWSLHLSGGTLWPTTLSPKLLHGHEMLFGFGGAAIAGFLLTAVATWTRRPPVSGITLGFLTALWMTARLTALVPGGIGWMVWGTSSLLFWTMLTALMAREVIAAKNRRNYKIVPLLLAFAIVEAAFFFGSRDDFVLQERLLRVGLMLILGMISLVAGRIIPVFTLNWLKTHRPDLKVRLPTFNRWDQAAVVMTTVFAVGFVLRPFDPVTGWLGLASSMVQIGRLQRWHGRLTWQNPLLWVLHLSYLWIPVGLVLLGLAGLGQPTLHDAGIHALTVGAIGTSILGVSARVALGHTGRPLVASPLLHGAFWLITLAAILRVTAPIGSLVVAGSALLWAMAYLIFLIIYLPILISPSVDNNNRATP